jgi:hypothetical protein
MTLLSNISLRVFNIMRLLNDKQAKGIQHNNTYCTGIQHCGTQHDNKNEFNQILNMLLNVVTC